MSGNTPSSHSIRKFADALAWFGGLLGLLFIALWPISILIWVSTYFISRLLINQAALMSKLETIETILMKTQPESETIPVTEAVQES